jgi:hypothetical protein
MTGRRVRVRIVMNDQNFCVTSRELQNISISSGVMGCETQPAPGGNDGSPRDYTSAIRLGGTEGTTRQEA